MKVKTVLDLSREPTDKDLTQLDKFIKKVNL